jgi:hypothetical protein
MWSTESTEQTEVEEPTVEGETPRFQVKMMRIKLPSEQSEPEEEL